MADVAANSKSEVATDGAFGVHTCSMHVHSLHVRKRLTRRGGKRVGRTEHSAASLDSIKTLPDHADNGAGSHVLDETREEGLALEVSVV